jgi:hypothetical protein
LGEINEKYTHNMIEVGKKKCNDVWMAKKESSRKILVRN